MFETDWPRTLLLPRTFVNRGDRRADGLV